MAIKKDIDLNAQAEEIIRLASEHGVQNNFFFLTTFKRYQVQLTILLNLEKTIKEQGPLVTKEYVKGRRNEYAHPAIGEYNKTATAANQTVQTLMRIIKNMQEETPEDGEENDGDALMAFLRGHR